MIIYIAPRSMAASCAQPNKLVRGVETPKKNAKVKNGYDDSVRHVVSQVIPSGQLATERVSIPLVQ